MLPPSQIGLAVRAIRPVGGAFAVVPRTPRTGVRTGAAILHDAPGRTGVLLRESVRRGLAAGVAHPVVVPRVHTLTARVGRLGQDNPRYLRTRGAGVRSAQGDDGGVVVQVATGVVRRDVIRPAHAKDF